MKKLNKELACLSRLVELSSLEEVISKLSDLNIIEPRTIPSVVGSSSPCKEIHAALVDAKNNGKLQLLEYEWQILPKEIIKITLVTDKSNADLSVAVF